MNNTSSFDLVFILPRCLSIKTDNEKATAQAVAFFF